MKVENANHPSDEQLKEFFARAGTDQDGPVVMLNMLKFRECAAYPDGRDAHLSGAEAYTRYGLEVKKIVEGLGGKMLYAGAVDGLMIGHVEELWDQVALVRYPSRKTFFDMVMMPEYRAIEVHREAGLAGQLNIGVNTLLGG